MATADKVTVELEVKRGKFDSDISAARARFTSEIGKITGATDRAERQIRSSTGEIGRSLRSLAGGIAAGATVGAVVKLADGYTQLQNRLRVVGLEGDTLAAVQDRLYAAGNRNGVAVGDLAQLYSRVALSAGELGASQSQLLSLTDGVTAALRVQGVSAQEASGPLLQLGQALGAGIVRAEEYNSIIEGVPILAQAAAKGLERTGGSVAKLRTEVIEGKVSSQEFFQALLRGLPDVERQAQSSTLTISQSLQALNNELGRWVGQTDKSLSASQRLSAGILGLANNLDKIVPALGIIATFFGVTYVGSVLKAGLATDGFITKSGAAISGQIAGQRALTTATVLSTDARVAAIRSEIAAQTVLAATGRNSLGQFVSRTAATQALTAATGQLAAAQTAASRASLLASTGLVRGVGAAKALGSGLLALAGGPIGIAILAVAGLAAGIAFLIQRQSEAAVAARAEAKAKEALAPANTELEKLVRRLATANEAETKSIRDKIAALVDEAKIKATIARQAYLEEKAREKAIQDRSREFRASAGPLLSAGAVGGGFSLEQGPNPGTAPNGNPIDTVADTSELRRLRAEAEKLEEGYRVVAEAAADATTAVSTASAAASGGGKSPKGKTAEQLAREAEQRARLLADLEASTRLEEASLAQDVAKVRELERQAEITARIRQLKDAGLSADQAQRVSSEVQGRLDEARLRDIERRASLSAAELRLNIANLNENYELVRQEELKVEYATLLEARKATTLTTEEAIKQANEDLLAIEEARVEAAQRFLTNANKTHQARIAELTGNTKLLKQLNDQAEIERRIAEYRQNGRLSKQDATTQATNEVTAERAATTYGEQREFFANTFSEGIRAALAGDLQGFLASQFGNLADMALKKLGESLFDSAFQAPAAVAQAQAEGVAQGLSFSATVGPAIVTAGGTAATAMGTAILAAGTQAAALMASANATSSLPIPGFANGTRSAPGGMAIVGERGPELVNLPRGSQVIPNHQLRSGGRNQQPIVKLVVEESAYFAPKVASIAGPISVQAAGTGVAYSNNEIQTANKRRGQSFI